MLRADGILFVKALELITLKWMGQWEDSSDAWFVFRSPVNLSSLRSSKLSKFAEDLIFRASLETSAQRMRNLRNGRLKFKFAIGISAYYQPTEVSDYDLAFTTTYLNDNLITFGNISDHWNLEWHPKPKKKEKKVLNTELDTLVWLTPLLAQINVRRFTARCFKKSR